MIRSALVELVVLLGTAAALVAGSLIWGLRRGWDRGWDEGYEAGGDDAMRIVRGVSEEGRHDPESQRQKAWLQ